MTSTLAGTKYVWKVRARRLRQSFIYHYGANREVNLWANMVGLSVRELRQRVRALIRKCHHAALIQSMGVKCHPEVYGLGLGSLMVFYTVEPNAIVIRGFAPNLPGGQVPEEIEGGFYCEPSWWGK